jgi:hypothetical protein
MATLMIVKKAVEGYQNGESDILEEFSFDYEALLADLYHYLN